MKAETNSGFGLSLCLQGSKGKKYWFSGWELSTSFPWPFPLFGGEAPHPEVRERAMGTRLGSCYHLIHLTIGLIWVASLFPTKESGHR